MKLKTWNEHRQVTSLSPSSPRWVSWRCVFEDSCNKSPFTFSNKILTCFSKSVRYPLVLHAVVTHGAPLMDSKPLSVCWTNFWWSIILWAYRFWQSRVWKQISLSDPWCQRVPVGTTACLISPSILLFLEFHVFPNRNNCRLWVSLSLLLPVASFSIIYCFFTRVSHVWSCF